MGANTSIEWCDHTWNPWEGCTKVSPGCAHCYAEARNKRFAGGANWGPGAPRRRTSEANWRQPLKWDAIAKLAEDLWEAVNHPECPPETKTGVIYSGRPRVFCASLADWLDDEVPIEWLADLLGLIAATPNLDWLLLTKRPHNWYARVNDVHALLCRPGVNTESESLTRSFVFGWLSGVAPANVWIGTTVEDQARANERIPHLLRIPARVRFLSCEPLLERVEFTDVSRRADWKEVLGKPALAGVHWVICGGESGPGARPMLVEWAEGLRRQCQAVGVPFFMKQLGGHVGTTNANAHDWPEHVTFNAVAGTPQFAGARVVLTDRKGGDFEEFPSELQERQFPNP
jgi:protein gp37